MFLLFSACSTGLGRPGEGVSPENIGTPETPFTIKDKSQLIGGPLAIGRVGDVLLENDKIRVIIQKPGKNAGLGSFGGTIIDADLVRSGKGQDQFGEILPMVNVEWTINYYNYEMLSLPAEKGRKVLRAYGRIDVYDYLDVDFISELAQGIAGQKLAFANRFDDRRDPFQIYDDLKGVDPEVMTDYTLEAGSRVVKIETTIRNRGDKEVRMPVGEFINGSGALSTLVPGVGFSPDFTKQAASHTPAIIYAGFEGVPVSYGYFYDPREFLDPETGEPMQTTSVTFAGVTSVLLGETFLKILPLGDTGIPEIHFSIPPRKERKFTRYFVVGDGSAGSVMDVGLAVLKIPTRPIVGSVHDSKGNPVEGALVALRNKTGATVVTYRTNKEGKFSGQLPSGDDAISQTFGKGIYEADVEKSGYHANETNKAGACTPEMIDLTTGATAQVHCILGDKGVIAFEGPITDASTGKPIVARLTIVGEDPSPNESPTGGVFYDNDMLMRPYGIVDMKYITIKGTVGLTESKSFELEPGVYTFVFSHGPEYAVHQQVVEVGVDQTVTMSGIALSRVVETPGYISADFHLHAINSPDSSFSNESRALAAIGEGLDILQSSDHDFLTNYQPALQKLVSLGLITARSIQTSIGNEVTPNQYGHLHAFPLEHDPEDVNGGAVDWSASPLDEVSTAPDYAMGLSELISTLREDPGEEVIQMNHIADVTGIPMGAGWVTSPFYAESFGVNALSSYADPIERRLQVDGLSSLFPKPFGMSDLVTADFNAVELVVGDHLQSMNILFHSALPSWFNLLNLGVLVTATANSDSHAEAKTPIGIPRNYIVHSVDPRDGTGNYGEIELEEYAANINAGKVVISAGPFIKVVAGTSQQDTFTVGDLVPSRSVILEIEVKAPSWAWFDTIEIYMNTEPLPADDVTHEPMTGTAIDPAVFYDPYHLPRYTYQPTHSFRLLDSSLRNWKEENGVIVAQVTKQITVDEDTWIVVMARGTRLTEGYRSLFPIVTNVTSEKLEELDPADLSSVHSDSRVGAPAWGLTNPIYLDADGDGEFKAKYVRDGRSPLLP